MSHSQFHRTRAVLRHAWLNLWDKHMTTGRINQIDIFPLILHSRPEWMVCVCGCRRAPAPHTELQWSMVTIPVIALALQINVQIYFSFPSSQNVCHYNYSNYFDWANYVDTWLVMHRTRVLNASYSVQMLYFTLLRFKPSVRVHTKV